MNNDNYWIILLGMSCITFSCRYLFLSKQLPFELGTKAKSILSYTAPSVLTAMWVPIVFLSESNIEQSFFTNPFLIAGLVCVFLSLKLKNTFLIVVLSMSIFLILRLI
ncbi:AzlD domain-containing protein [Psychromonas algicola]|uniref:AzlD domain-containing protein n=1 Tax=Psychromonas algicola TaxID=2555642 RepID=UPI001068520B|nr:AzlD domain-containing protein [Psychromonas sp. RZ5]TEW52348.1 AzlD domain-containing protein [Psychromonas sp. RZ5]